MTTVEVNNGELVTSTATEQEIKPKGPFEPGVQVIALEVVSGTLKFGVGPAGGSPVIDGDQGTYGSYTTDNPKTYRTIQVGTSHLRVSGVGTFIPIW